MSVVEAAERGCEELRRQRPEYDAHPEHRMDALRSQPPAPLCPLPTPPPSRPSHVCLPAHWHIALPRLPLRIRVDASRINSFITTADHTPPVHCLALHAATALREPGFVPFPPVRLQDARPCSGVHTHFSTRHLLCIWCLTTVALRIHSDGEEQSSALAQF